MNEDILKFCLEKGMLLDKETFNLLENFNSEDAKKLIERISRLKEKIITRAFLTKNAERLQEIINDEKIVEKLKINFGLTFEISREHFIEKKEAEEQEEKAEEKTARLDNIKVIYSLANLTKKLEPGDFVRHFRNRYQEMRRILQGRQELENLVSISKINGQKQAISIIATVFDKRITKNKNIFLEAEDLTGKITVLISKNKAGVYDKAKEILADDTIGIKGFGNREIIFANDIVYPDSHLAEKISIEREEKAAFISDIHVGSRNFLEKNFLKFISWLNGEVGDGKQIEEAKKIKYLFVCGDNIDGVGVFPGQSELLEIKDINEQYKRLAELLGKIRKDIKIIVCPGQHDAVRVAEPQPFIGKNYGQALYELENVILVSNPAIIEIGNGNGKRGLKILMYHGASMNSFINEIDRLRLEKAHDFPSKVVREILKRRHLASMHSSVTYIPTEKEDFLVIKEVPDIITTADLHKPDVDIYNNVLIICSSCWQSTTPFEEKVGNHPDPCKVPVLNLKTREIKILDFSDAEEDKKCKETENKIVCEVKT